MRDQLFTRVAERALECLVHVLGTAVEPGDDKQVEREIEEPDKLLVGLFAAVPTSLDHLHALSDPSLNPAKEIEPRRRSRSANRREKVIASLLAAAADCGADATVLVVRGVELALLGAGEAGRRTSFDHCADEAEIGRGLPCHDPAGRIARVGTVEVEPNAADQLRQIAFGQTSVCAGSTAGRTVETLVDAAEESVSIQAARIWMQADDLLKSHVLPLSVEAVLVAAARRPSSPGERRGRRPKGDVLKLS